MNRRTILLILTITLVIGAFLRLYLITEVPLGLHPNEAINGNNALEALETGGFKFYYPENNGREGLYINSLALPLWAFGNEPFVIRVVSALFGILTILGVYLLTREFFRREEYEKQNNPVSLRNASFSILDVTTIALLSSFFFAVSYWHVNFSRIGFREILIPFFAVFGMYFLLKGLRRGTVWDLVWAGVFVGLGFHAHSIFGFIALVLAIPLIGYLRNWRKNTIKEKYCIPCMILLFLLIMFVVALPIGIYFLQHTGDFTQSLTTISSVKEFVQSNVLTMGIFLGDGDCSWLNNYGCKPQLHSIVGFFFIVGLIAIIYRIFKKPFTESLTGFTLLTWLLFMSLPATLTPEDSPNALRSIGMIPPIMILAGFGAWWILQKLILWFEKQKNAWPGSRTQISRIQRWILFLFILTPLILPVDTFRTYFRQWAFNGNTYAAFSTDTLHLGQYLKRMPTDIQKYVFVNQSGTLIRGIPLPAQIVMFATNTFPEDMRRTQNITYATTIDSINPSTDAETLITLIDGLDRAAIVALKEKFPSFRESAPGAFTVFQNY
jgi:4-amino-4-deoxy-L-arabinose transferase-like glycosyltransferase